MLKKDSKIYVSGHTGLVGSAIEKRLREKGYRNIITRTSKQLNLLDQKKVFQFFKKNKIQFVFNAAAKVGGIKANQDKKADFIYENLTIQNNIIYGCFKNGIKNLIFLSSSCVYPKNIHRPIKEEDLLRGKLEKTNEPYAIAKIAGIVMCESYNKQYGTNYRCLMPCNIYGPNDNYNTDTSHFFPALIKKIHNAKERKKNAITLWGNGKAKRELLFSEDLADACIYFMKNKTDERLINIGSNVEMTILDYANFIMKELKVSCKINFDKTKPNGTKRKKLDLSLIKKYKWKSQTNLKNGFKKTYKSFLEKNQIMKYKHKNIYYK